MNDISSEIEKLARECFAKAEGLRIVVSDYKVMDTDGMAIAELTDKLLHLIQSQREELIARFEGIIGADEEEVLHAGYEYSLTGREANKLRAEQRNRLKEMSNGRK